LGGPGTKPPNDFLPGEAIHQAHGGGAQGRVDGVPPQHWHPQVEHFISEVELETNAF
jgi:hypothetical protein